jgi:hypothetical protein
MGRSACRRSGAAAGQRVAARLAAQEVRVSLPDTLPAGEYSVVVGMYDWQSGYVCGSLERRAWWLAGLGSPRTGTREGFGSMSLIEHCPPNRTAEWLKRIRACAPAWSFPAWKTRCIRFWWRLWTTAPTSRRRPANLAVVMAQAGIA